MSECLLMQHHQDSHLSQQLRSSMYSNSEAAHN